MGSEPIDIDLERQLIENFRNGDQHSFEVLYEHYKRRVYGVALYVSRNDGAAEELTQQVFVKAYTKLKDFQGKSRLGTWLHRMTVNLWIDDQRKNNRAPTIGLDDSFSDVVISKDSVEKNLLQDEMSSAIRVSVANLSEKLRTVFVLKYLADLSYKEIAELLECSVGTVGSRLNRCLKILSEDLSQFGN